jgi:hypothetical protein
MAQTPPIPPLTASPNWNGTQQLDQLGGAHFAIKIIISLQKIPLSIAPALTDAAACTQTLILLHHRERGAKVTRPFHAARKILSRRFAL